MHETVIPENADIGRNNIYQNQALNPALPLHVLYKRKDLFRQKNAATNITIQKITERFKSTSILEVTDDKGVIHLLINIKCIVIVVESSPPLSKYATLYGT